MPVRNYKPNTPWQRKRSVLINEEITKSTPEKSLVVSLKKNGGRNNQGRITVRHQGGGAKRKYRVIDSNVTNTIFQVKLLQLNTIQIELQILH